MLVLITGQPGNGKTLYTLGLVEKLRQESGREVYHAQGGKPGEGIPDLTLPWKILENPELWHELPNGSIVVIDECQHVFRVRKQGAAVPLHVSEFETHRHRGFDVYLITQHPQLLDIAVRKLTGRHFDVKRTFGQEKATVRQWERAVDPNDRSVKNEALLHAFPFPKERFGWYKSADIHTVKKEMPWKKFTVLAASVVGAVGLAALSFGLLSNKVSDPSSEVAVSEQLGPFRSAVAQPGIDARFKPEAFDPRAPQLPWSAPRYDVVVRETTAPRVSGCLELKFSNGARECRCADQHGARVQLDPAVCRDYVKNGIFDPTRPDFDAKAENIKRLDSAGQSSGSEVEGEPSRPSNALSSVTGPSGPA